MATDLTEAVVIPGTKPTFEQAYADSLPSLVRLARVALYDVSRGEPHRRARTPQSPP